MFSVLSQQRVSTAQTHTHSHTTATKQQLDICTRMPVAKTKLEPHTRHGTAPSTACLWCHPHTVPSLIHLSFACDYWSPFVHLLLNRFAVLVVYEYNTESAIRLLLGVEYYWSENEYSYSGSPMTCVCLLRVCM